MKKKILIIGFGSIGKRHAFILNKFRNVGKVFILTKQKIRNFTTIKDFKKIKFINPDYILVCSKTSDHYKHLKFIEKNFKNKIILIEKPLFDKSKKLKIKKNKVFVGYNLRYHPIIKFIKEKIKSKKIFSVYASCCSYMPYWRKNQNYKYSYSSSKKYGGGALLDLSHEIDYIQWIFGKIKKIHYSKIKKISNLSIKSDDFVSIVGSTNKINYVINLNYFSIYPKREIIIDGKNFSLKADLIKNHIYLFENGKFKNIKFNINKNYTYKMQHEALLKKNHKVSCTYKDAEQLMLLIDKVRIISK